MTIVKDILKQLPAVRQPQAKFLEILFSTILALRGHVTLRNLIPFPDRYYAIALTQAVIKYSNEVIELIAFSLKLFSPCSTKLLTSFILCGS